jgi:hypothetical protein
MHSRLTDLTVVRYDQRFHLWLHANTSAMKHLRNVACLASAILLVPHADAENWPGWRGPRGDGSADVAGPMKWDGESGENVRWKTTLPGEGHSCPIIWDDKVFVTACLPSTEERVLICLDRDTGEKLWKKTVLKARLESKHALNSPCDRHSARWRR